MRILEDIEIRGMHKEKKKNSIVAKEDHFLQESEPRTSTRPGSWNLDIPGGHVVSKLHA